MQAPSCLGSNPRPAGLRAADNGIEATVPSAARHAPPRLALNDKGDLVALAQHLIAAQRVTCEIDGDFGPNTDKAVHTFQTRAGLSSDGVIGPKTWAALLDAMRPITFGAKGSLVKRIQRRLEAGRFAPGLIDGHFGANTADALSRFQCSVGLDATGALDVATALALLGEDAPIPTEPPVTPSRDLDRLTEEVLTAIAIKETKCQAIESGTETSAGVKASYASQVQATAAWTITALRKLPAEARARFGVTSRGLAAANARACAIGEVWDTVVEKSGSRAAVSLAGDARIVDALARSGLGRSDLDRMVAFRDLKAVMVSEGTAALAALHASNPAPCDTECTAAWNTAANRAAAHPSNALLGMSTGSLTTYIRRACKTNPSPIWHEDRAGWHRRAVEAGPEGDAIRRAATDDGGLALGRARIGALVRNFVEDHPEASEEDIVAAVAKLHNPHSTGYADAVVAIWRRLRQAA